jgi:hypothetical protein
VINPELWILETAFPVRIPLWMLVYPQIESLHNKPSHGLPPKPLAELLERLNWDGVIFIEDQDGQRRLFSAAELLQLLPVRTDDREHAYGLTEKGGARWEIEAQADWSRYLQDSELHGRDRPRVREIVGGDRERFESYVSRGMVEMGHVPDPASERSDVLTPWQATYWKTLPVGYRLRGLPSDRRFTAEEREAWLRWDQWLAWYRRSDGEWTH